MSQDNTEKNRIRRTQKKAKKTELEDHLRTVKSSLNKASVVDSKATSSIRPTAQNTKSDKTTVTTSPSANIDSNTPVLSSTGVTLVASASGLKSQDNTKKNRIWRTQKKAKETELEDHLRTVKSSLNKASVVDSKATSSVIKSVSNVNLNLKCASCNGCLFSDNHDACVIEYINSVNTSRKSKSVKKPVKRKVWKTTGKVFKTVGYKWTPTGWTFTLVENVCPLTRIATATITVNVCERYVTIETELQKNFITKKCYDTLFKKYNTLEKHCISLEVDNQLKKEIFLRNNSFSQQSAATFDQLFEINDLKAQSQEKDTVIMKLKERLKSLSGNVKEEKIKRELEEIETINIELDHKEKVLVIAALKKTLSKLKGKAVVTEAVTLHPIDPELLKIDVAPLALKLRNNGIAHTDYLRHTQEETATLREIVESERLLNPLNTSLDYACKSQPQGNTKKDRIQRAPSKAKKNKLEDHPRIVRPSLNKKKSIVVNKAISSATNSKMNESADLKCATCNGCLFSDNHDSCVLAYINFVNASLKSKSVKKTSK
nr:hypothetical protein [Tanacetum cinerariifolium]